MKNIEEIELDFEIDKLTNSIENIISGNSFATDVTLINRTELKAITKKNGWLFNWTQEFKYPERDIYKLTIVNNQNIIQGLISLEVKNDHVYRGRLGVTPHLHFLVVG